MDPDVLLEVLIHTFLPSENAVNAVANAASPIAKFG